MTPGMEAAASQLAQVIAWGYSLGLAFVVIVLLSRVRGGD